MSCGNAQDSDGGDGRHCSSPPMKSKASWSGSCRAIGVNSGAGGSCFGGFATSRSVGEPLAGSTRQGAGSAFTIFDPKSRAVRVAKIELGEIAMQVPFVAMLVDAPHPALENREKAFNGVGVHLPAHVFLGAVVDGFVAGELAPDAEIGAPLVGHQRALGIGVRENDLPQFVGSGVVSHERTSFTATFDERNDGEFVARLNFAPVPAALIVELPGIRQRVALFADESLVNLYNFSLATQRPEHIRVRSHHQPDPVAHVPSGAQGDAENAMQLVAADPLLRRAHEHDGLQPQVHWNVAVLEDGSDLDGKGLAAGVALPKAQDELAFGIELAWFGALVFQLPGSIHDAAMRADAAMRPQTPFDIGDGGLLVTESAAIENGIRHHLSPCGSYYNA